MDPVLPSGRARTQFCNKSKIKPLYIDPCIVVPMHWLQEMMTGFILHNTTFSPTAKKCISCSLEATSHLLHGYWAIKDLYQTPGWDFLPHIKKYCMYLSNLASDFVGQRPDPPRSHIFGTNKARNLWFEPFWSSWSKDFKEATLKNIHEFEIWITRHFAQTNYKNLDFLKWSLWNACVPSFNMVQTRGF